MLLPGFQDLAWQRLPGHAAICMRHTPAALANLLFTMSGMETQADMKEACSGLKIASSLAWTIANGALSICNTCQANTPRRDQAAHRDITQGSKRADDIAADPPLMSDVVPMLPAL